MKTTKIAMKPVWDDIEETRKTALKFIKDQRFTENTVYRVLMVMSELIENAIKYGHFSKPEDDIIVIISLLKQSAMIEVVHRTKESDAANLKKMDTIIQGIRSYQDPFEAYAKKLEEVANRSMDNNDSGLGLVRIAYEGGAVLDFIVDENEYINVTAVIPYE